MYRLILVFLSVLCSPAFAQQADHWALDQQDIMGTRIAVEIYHPDHTVRETALFRVFDDMRRIERLMSPWIEGSDVYRINAAAGQQPVLVSNETWNLISDSLEVSRLTSGAFDISFASVGHLFNYREAIAPDADTAAQNQQLIDYRAIRLSDNNQVFLPRKGMRIDLGGIAKGHAVDRAIGILKSLGIRHARVAAGGDSRLLGQRWGRPWVVGVKHPRKPDALLTRLPLQDVALSTSGDYERFFESKGSRFHHIIDPAAGDSARAVRSVTVIGDNGLYTDALSTGLFVLGPQKALDLVHELPDIEVIIVDKDGHILLSDGLAQPDQLARRENP